MLHADGHPVLAHPPGWYLAPFSLPVVETFGRMLPKKAIEREALKLKSDLARYPRRTPFREEVVTAVPRWALHVASYYIDPIFDLVFATAVELDDARCRTLPPARRSPRGRRGGKRVRDRRQG
jgi:hypothetical protein